MRRRASPELAQLIQGFFEEYLPGLRGLSTHTIHSYRDAVVLFLRFLARARERKLVVVLDDGVKSLDPPGDLLTDIAEPEYAHHLVRHLEGVESVDGGAPALVKVNT